MATTSWGSASSLIEPPPNVWPMGCCGVDRVQVRELRQLDEIDIGTRGSCRLDVVASVLDRHPSIVAAVHDEHLAVRWNLGEGGRGDDRVGRFAEELGYGAISDALTEAAYEVGDRGKGDHSVAVSAAEEGQLSSDRVPDDRQP